MKYLAENAKSWYYKFVRKVRGLRGVKQDNIRFVTSWEMFATFGEQRWRTKSQALLSVEMCR